MHEFLTDLTSLPNLHPALVHFPIALLPVAVLFDLVSHWRRREGLAHAATVLYVAAALGAGAAYWAGEQAADSLPVLAPAMQRLVNEHSDSALYTLWLVGVLAAVRIALDFWDRNGARKAVRWVALLFGDVQVELDLGLEGFEGAVGVVHHVRGADQAGVFTLEVPSNEHVLATVDGGAVRELDREAGEVPPDRVRLTVSAIGRHLKGLLGDQAVVHGHEPALPDGACGLLLRGHGTVRIHSVKVTPAG